MTHPHFFGYGSLVNGMTHSFAPIHTATVTGWRRVWLHAAERPTAFLSVIQDADSTIEGVIAPVPNADWAALDEREFAYERRVITGAVTHTAQHVRDISIYTIPPENSAPANRDHPILLSYLDAVLQGYLRAFGPAGVQRFCDTTEGWDTPVRNDRADPLYPRAQTLSDAEQSAIDATLHRLHVTFV